jgi:tetratricopeptide (TPR) repeat protein
VGRGLGRAGHGRLGWLRVLVAYPAYASWRFLARLGWLLGQWWSFRNTRYFLQGLPAVLCLSAVVTLGAFARFKDPSDLVLAYQAQAAKALAEKDYALAQTCFEKLATFEGEHKQAVYWLGLTLEAADRKADAAAVMLNLAPPDKAGGYRPAHLWQARHLLTGQPGLPQQQLAERHLLRALEGDNPPADASALYAQLLLATKRTQEAEAHLVRAVETHPELRIPLAKIYAARRDREKAQTQLQRAVEAFRQRAEGSLDDHRDRLYWAETTLLQGKFAEAQAILEKGLTASSRPEYRVAMSRVTAAWFDALGADPRADLGARIGLLEAGLKADPFSGELLQRLLTVTKLKGAEAARARDLLETVLAQGQVPATVHLMLGIDAWQDNRAEEARRHWELAYQSDPLMPVLANNLAWLLAHQPPADLPRALQMIDSVVARYPNEPQYRGTRGHILAKLGRWQDAVPDLEASLKAFPNNVDLHKQLAAAYDQLGLPSVAAKHKQLAETAAGKAAFPTAARP